MRVESLTFFRFFAAIVVVNYHYGVRGSVPTPGSISVPGSEAVLATVVAPGFEAVLSAGPQMVSFYFVLSGFVMALGYASRAHFSVIDYWRARVARIAPLYFVALAPVVTANLWVGNLNITATVLSATFVQAWVPSFALSLNFVAWSVSVEVLFYASFPVLVWLINTRRMMPISTRPTGTRPTGTRPTGTRPTSTRPMGTAPARLLTAAALLWLTTEVVLSALLSSGFHAGTGTSSHDLIAYFPPVHFCSFVLGVASGYWYQREARKSGVALSAGTAISAFFCLSPAPWLWFGSSVWRHK
jgi:peptidoglycan/LPS O-acetylase OafA/YrhL